MKLINNKIFSFFLILTMLSTISCKKELPQIAPLQYGLGLLSNVQVINATVKATRNYIYVDGTPVSGSSLAYQGVFPATAYAFSVNPGVRNFLIKDTAISTTQVPLNFAASLISNRSYTIFTYDTTTSTKQLTVMNNITIPQDTSSMLRFANFIYNTSAVANVDVYSYKRGGITSAPVFSNIATNQVTDFVPFPSGVTDTLYVYPTGNVTTLLIKKVVLSLVATRSYSAVYNGSF